MNELLDTLYNYNETLFHVVFPLVLMGVVLAIWGTIQGAINNRQRKQEV